MEVNHYRVNVNRFRARLNVVCITEKLLVDLKCDGWPEVRAIDGFPVMQYAETCDHSYLSLVLNSTTISRVLHNLLLCQCRYEKRTLEIFSRKFFEPFFFFLTEKYSDKRHGDKKLRRGTMK